MNSGPHSNAPSVGCQDTVERDALREFTRSQFMALQGRHSLTTAVLVRVMADEYQQCVLLAKDSRLHAARSRLQVLDSLTATTDPEIRDLHSLAQRPAWGLMHWLDGDLPAAEADLTVALTSAARLAEAGHDYLTPKQLHLATNILRLRLSRNDLRPALRLAEDLKRVMDGDSTGWTFPGRQHLSLPISGEIGTALRSRLNNIAGRLIELSKAAQ